MLRQICYLHCRLHSELPYGERLLIKREAGKLPTKNIVNLGPNFDLFILKKTKCNEFFNIYEGWTKEMCIDSITSHKFLKLYELYICTFWKTYVLVLFIWNWGKYLTNKIPISNDHFIKTQWLMPTNLLTDMNLLAIYICSTLSWTYQFT